MVGMICFDPKEFRRYQGRPIHNIVDTERGKFPGISVSKAPARFPEGINQSFLNFSVSIGLWGSITSVTKRASVNELAEETTAGNYMS